jgi:hypothetical protein
MPPTRLALLLAVLPTLAAAQPTRLVVVERATTNHTAPVAKGPDNAGDILTFANEIFDSEDRTRIGADQGFCIRIIPGHAYDCEWTTTLAGGSLAVQGPFSDTGDTTLAITGGTGQYAGARGEMKLHARDAQGSAYDFDFSLKP